MTEEEKKLLEIKQSDGVDEVETMLDNVYYNSEALTFSELGDTTFKFNELASGLNMLSDVFWSLNNRIKWTDKSDEEKVTLIKENRTSMASIGDRLISEFENSEKSLFKKMIGKLTSIVSSNKEKEDSTDKEKDIALKGAKNEFWVWKEEDGTHRWFSVYSNMFRDKEQEIITSASHERFQELIDKGVEPYPELWLWHVPGTRVGEADWIYYDKDTGFAMASGYFDKGKEHIAKGLSEIKDLATSHGMPNSSIVREDGDELAIVEHVTREISPLLLWAAANPLTGFEILKEEDMPIPEDKKAFLRDAGMNDEDIATVEKRLATASKEAKERLDYKEIESTDGATEEIVEEVVEEEVEEEATEEEATEEEVVEKDDSDGEFQKGVLEALKAVTTSIETISARIDGMEKSNEESAEEIRQEVLKDSFAPPAALAEILGRNLKITNQDEAQVKGSTKIGKSMPVEADDDTVAEDVVTSVINGLFQ